jgi:hypothetical protein
VADATNLGSLNYQRLAAAPGRPPRTPGAVRGQALQQLVGAALSRLPGGDPFGGHEDEELVIPATGGEGGERCRFGLRMRGSLCSDVVRAGPCPSQARACRPCGRTRCSCSCACSCRGTTGECSNRPPRSSCKCVGLPRLCVVVLLLYFLYSCAQLPGNDGCVTHVSQRFSARTPPALLRPRPLHVRLPFPSSASTQDPGFARSAASSQAVHATAVLCV